MAGYQDNQKKKREFLSWLIVIIALAVFWPLGLILLFRKLFQSSGRTGSHRAQGRAVKSRGRRASVRRGPCAAAAPPGPNPSPAPPKRPCAAGSPIPARPFTLTAGD